MRRRRADPFEPQQRYNGLSQADVNQLATYNAEHARGILHDARWQEQMAVLQARFDAAEQERARNDLVDQFDDPFLTGTDRGTAKRRQ